MNLDKNNIKKLLFIIFFAAAIFSAFENLGIILHYVGIFLTILIPFFIGGAIAFVLNIPMKAAEKHIFENKKIFKKGVKKSVARPLSLIMAIIFVVIIFSAVVNIVLPQLISTLYSIGNSVYTFVPKLMTFCRNIFGNILIEENINYYAEKLMKFDWNTIFSYIADFLKSGGSMINSTIGVVSTIFSTTVNIIIGFIFALYILLQKEKLSVQAVKIIFAVFKKNVADEIISIARLSYKTFSNFITGQCLEACILGFMFFIILNIFRIPYSLLIGVLIAFTALIPIVGAFIGCFISSLLILMINPLQAVIFIVIFLVIQQVEGNLIYPHVVGNSVGLPSIWVLVSVTLGGKLFGVMGMLLFIPFASVVYTLFKKWVNTRISKNKIDINKYV